MNKQKVIKILKKLKPYRELSEGMIALIEAGFMDKETYQNTLFMVAAAIKKMPEGAEKENLRTEFEKLKGANKNENLKENSD